MTATHDPDAATSPTRRESAQAGFITAVWASGGLAILAAGLFDEMADFMGDNGLAAVLFVTATYASSYLFGRLLARERIRSNIFFAVPVAFVVSTLVLATAGVFGGAGATITALASGQVDPDAFAPVFVVPFVMTLWGVMFTGPLSLGLGITARLWHAWTRR